MRRRLWEYEKWLEKVMWRLGKVCERSREK